ncbi:MAG: tRNA (adenosine(37)-N6)-dimethylallyltransferase MiaA, partial [Alistipes sp.]|nr:tRNA (adenosine(37)-N6)-dimethylallyltransferase MiaA [Candidatus Minthomonas equi]
ELKSVDPVAYGDMDIANTQRIVRALEVFYISGKPYSSFRTGMNRLRPFYVERYCLTRARDVLYDRINRRVDDMLEKGLVDEVRALVQYRNMPALQTVGYKEIFDYLDGTITLERARELIQRNTRRYAKRQLSWWRRAVERNRAECPLNWIEMH